MTTQRQRRRRTPAQTFEQESKFIEAGYTIRKRVQRGKEYIQVDLGQRNGKRKLMMRDAEGNPFRTLGEARTFCRQKRAEVTNFGTQSLSLSTRDRLDAVAARQILGNVPILEAAQFYAQHHASSTSTTSIADLADEFVAAQTSGGKRAATVKDDRQKLNVFCKDFGESMVHSVTLAAIEEWLLSKAWSPRNRINHIRVIHKFFEYLRKRNVVAANPAEHLEKPQVDAPEYSVHTPTELNRLIKAAAEVNDAGDVLTYIVLHYFAGLRPNEIMVLKWQDIILEENIIRVRPEVAKKRRQRPVEISPNLNLWLLKLRKSDGPVCGIKYHSLRRRIRAAAENVGVDLWHDCGRHAFASYHLAAHKDAAHTSHELGHRDSDLLYSTYRGLVTQKAAKQFWKIRPPRKKNVISFPKRVA